MSRTHTAPRSRRRCGAVAVPSAARVISARHTPPKWKLARILVPLDFSGNARKSLDYALPLARQFNASIHLLHVVEGPRFAHDPHIPQAPIPDEGSGLRAKEKLRQITNEMGVARLTFSICFGEAFYGIAATAREIEADLIVISTHGYTGWKRALLGSTTERVIRHAPCPVLVVREREHEFAQLARLPEGVAAPDAETRERESILVPVDFSKGSLKALHYALAFAKEFQAGIDLLYVSPGAEVLHQYGDIDADEVERQMRKSAEERLAVLAGQELSADVRVRPVVRTGRAASGIVAIAREVNSSLMIISTHGYTGLRQFFMGSIAAEVVRCAPCPVLVVREKEHEFIA